MTGFDPTAPERDTSNDEPEEVEGNVVPPDELTDDGPTPTDEPASSEDLSPSDD